MATAGKQIGEFISKRRDRLAKLLLETKITPNMLTLAGLAVNLFAAILLAAGAHRTAGFIMILANSFDVLDGALAKALNRLTRFGDFLDSTIDRYSDLFIFSGLIVFYSIHQKTVYVILVCIAMTGAVATSYIRAKGQNVLSVKCDAGFMERPERIITLIFGALFNHIHVSIWILAFLTQLTVIHRMLYVKKGLEKLPETEDSDVKPDIYEGKSPLVSLLLKILFLDFERMTWQYDLACAAIIFTLIFSPF